MTTMPRLVSIPYDSPVLEEPGTVSLLKDAVELQPTVIEARPVDDPAPPAAGWMAERQARLVEAPRIIPTWLRDRAQLSDGTRFVLRWYGHMWAYHAVRVPAYSARLWIRAPRGAVRLGGRWTSWVTDAEARPVEAKAAASDPQTWMQFVTIQSRRTGPRRRMSIVVAVPAALLVTLAYVLLPGWAALLAAAGIATVLGWAGRDADRPIVHRYVHVRMQRRLDSGEVELALESIGVKGRLDFVHPIAVDGPGWRAELDLPPGVLADTILEKRAELAAAMRRPLGCVWPETDRDAHPGRLNLWVARQDPAKAKRRIWQLMREGQADLFKEIPYGFDPRGRPVSLRLMYSNVLIGGVMGSGKTSAVLVIALAGALDPTCELWLYEMKGSGDLEAVRPVCHRYVSGDDDEHCKAALDALRALEKEMKRRKDIIKDLPVSDVPNGRKTYPHLAKRRSLGLHPLLAIFDECFPAGTLVGGRPIESLRAGDIVPSWDEKTGKPCDGVVAGTMRRVPSALVRIHWHNGTAIVCTPNHPLMTRHGWRAAGDLTADSEVLTYGEAKAPDHGSMLELRDRVHSAPVQEGLLQEVGTGDLFARVQEGVHAAIHDAGVADLGGGAQVALTPNDGKESYAGPRREGPGGERAEDDGAPATSPGRERPGTDRASTSAGRGALVAHGGDRADRAGLASEGTSDALQAGHRECRSENSSRGGRRIARDPEAPGAGPAENCMAHWRRVDRVEILEPGSDGRYGGLCPDGYVYNFEVANTHVYRVADGVVAHNCHSLFEHPEYGELAAEIATRLVKKARAYGIILVLTTQRPDAKSIPRGVSDNAIGRILLAVTGHIPNDLIAGTGAYKRGVRGTMFDPERDAGTGWLIRSALNAQIVRAAFITQGEAVEIGQRALALRIAAGTLTGQAAGQEIEQVDESTIVDHLRAVWPAGEETMHSATLVEALAAWRPEEYRAWLGEMPPGAGEDELRDVRSRRSTMLAAALKPYGIQTRQINKRGSGGGGKGLRWEDLAGADPGPDEVS